MWLTKIQGWTVFDLIRPVRATFLIDCLMVEAGCVRSCFRAGELRKR